MTKRDTESGALQWDADDPPEIDEPAGDVAPAGPAGLRPGFHLQAARKIEEARERRQLRKALEDFDDYDV